MLVVQGRHQKIFQKGACFPSKCKKILRFFAQKLKKNGNFANLRNLRTILRALGTIKMKINRQLFASQRQKKLKMLRSQLFLFFH